MTFSYTQQHFTPEELDPISGAMKRMLANRQSMQAVQKNNIQLQYLPKSLQAELLKAQQYNEMYKPNIQSQMDLRRAQQGQVGAQTGLIGQQTLGEQLKNQLLPQNLALAQQKAALQQQLMGKIFNKGSTSFSGASMPDTQNEEQPRVAGIATGEPENQGSFSPMALGENQAQPESDLTYPQAALAMQMLGLGHPKVENLNGKMVAITPFGNIDTGARALSEEQKAMQSGLGKYGAKLYEESVNGYRGYQNQATALQTISDAIQNNPDFRHVTGKINKPLTTWLGTPEQQQLLGTLQSASGEIALQVAPSLKGAWTGRDQALVNEIKASPNDFPDVFIGKLKAQSLINNVLGERARLTAQYIEQGYKPLEASQMAAKKTPLSRFKPAIDKMLNANHPADTQVLNGVTYERVNGKWRPKK